MTSKKNAHIASETFKILRTLYQLTTDFFSSENRQDLSFRILNNTINLFEYRRAALWSFEGGKQTLLGISGREDVNSQAPVVLIWKKIVSSLGDIRDPQILENRTNGNENAFKELAEKTSGISVIWIPIMVNGKITAGLWLERWGKNTWDSSECEVLSSLSQNINLAWKHYTPPPRWHSLSSFRSRRSTIAVMIIVLIFLLFFPIVSLRIVAPCEIVPENSVLVAAPIDGVIKEIIVKPGEKIKKGDLLFTYEDSITIQKLKVAQKQVQIIKSQYNRMRYKSFTDNQAMAEVKGLEFRLKQEKIRLQLAEVNAGHLNNYSRLDGVCMIDDPEYFRGRPVQIGERIMMIFDPLQSKVKIFLPENDNIVFDREKPVNIILNAAPGRRYKATLQYVAPQTSEKPGGGSYFLAEASSNLFSTPIKVGLKGSAIVYGKKVSFIYWLLRKPLSGVRQFLGI